MNISSPIFKIGEEIPSRYTCDGKNVSPTLLFSDIPPAAKTLALVVDDPDSFAGVWTHWLVWNIPPTTKEIREGSVPKDAREGLTSFNTVGYRGPCPRKGNHRYFFKLYALDIALSLPGGSSKDALIEAMRGHILADAEVYGRYERKKQDG
jgi:Raf kinase inhibitor-like YbhB/YbcL family protein